MKLIRTRQHIEEGMAYLLKCDRRLVELAARAGEIPLRLEAPGFEGLVRIIVAQQVSRASAQAIFGRLCEQVHPLTPERFLAVGAPVWRLTGLSRAKQETLEGLSRALAGQRLDLEQICELDADDAMRQLTELKGIGPWTAEVYLLFCAGHRDVFPAGDLALQIAVGEGLGLVTRPDDKTLRKIAETWSPWRGVAARLFWAYYAKMKQTGDAMPV